MLSFSTNPSTISFRVRQAQTNWVRPERFERPTDGFEVRCSIQLSYERSRRTERYQRRAHRARKKVPRYTKKGTTARLSLG